MGNCLLEILQICNAIIYQLIQQNSQMGSNPSQERTQKIMSLFYKPSKVWVTQEISLNLVFFDYGVCASPFEYQTQQENGQKSTQLIQLEDIFRKQYEEELGVKFNPEVKWEVGRLNSYLKTGRYSPLYYDDIGIINNKFLMSKVQFTKKWHQAFDIAIQNFLKPEELKDQKILNQKKNLLQMDWIHYRTLVVYAFRGENIPFDQIIKNRIATKYQIYMRDKFESKVINQKYKIQKLLRRLTKFDIDIFFLQDIDERILKYIEKKTNQFRIARCRFSKSAILISREALKKIVGDSIRPLAHYNRKYLDPEKKYEFGKQFDFGQKDKSSLQSTHFETNQNRNFEFAKRKQVKVAKKTELKKLHSLQQNQTRIQQKQQQSKMKKQHSLNPDVVNENFKQNHPNLQLLSNSLIGQQQSLQTIDQMGQSNQLLSGQEQLIEESQNNHTKVEGEATYAYIDPQVFKGLAWNDNTLVQFLSNIILITSSLDFEFEELQFKKMIQSLNSLHKIYPNHVIVAAVDVQKDINLEELSGFYIFPNQKEKKIPTVYKKKTLIQSKVHKAGHLFANTEDYFLSTAKLYDPMVMDIDHNETQENPRLIPSETHPYDHYLISATIKCKVTKKIIKETTEGE